MDVVGIIPARYGSTRLPGKPLADVGGMPLIRHVYERVCRALDQVIVATDDERVLRAVEGFGGRCALTRADHRCGTERVAEVAAGLAAGIIVNIQGDEPFIDPEMISEVVAPFQSEPDLQMSTLSREISDAADLENPGVVKVVTNQAGDALYFSRSLIPYPRHEEFCQWREHVGIYAYRRRFLLDYVRWPPTPLEQAESLEQLRVLERGYRIRVIETERGRGTFAIDTPEDLERANAYWARLQGRLVD